MKHAIPAPRVDRWTCPPLAVRNPNTSYPQLHYIIGHKGRVWTLVSDPKGGHCPPVHPYEATS
jgi:hypothetical protein